MEKQFDFKKLDGGKYAFVMISDDIERTEVVSKKFAKEHYEELHKQKKDLMLNLGKTNTDLAANDVHYDAELEHFILLANNAAKYKKYMDLRANQTTLLKMMGEIDTSMANMEKTIPELKRNKNNI